MLIELCTIVHLPRKVCFVEYVYMYIFTVCEINGEMMILIYSQQKFSYLIKIHSLLD